jgi:hypothetical protein
MNRLTFAYPTWFLIFCFLLGLGYALFLYYRDTTFQQQPPWLRWLMGVLRFLVVGFLATFLLSPLLRYKETVTRKPIIVVAQDVSESVRNALPGAKRKAYQEKLNALTQALGADYEVKPFSFGATVREGLDTVYKDKISNLADMLATATDLYSGDNLGAIVMASDGIYNEGNNPLYLAEKNAIPIYTVALGDTTPKKDLILKRAFYNKIVYLGDQFSVQMDIGAINCAGAASNVSVYKVGEKGNQQIQQSALSIDRADFFATRELVLSADQPGVQHYRLVLNKVPGEASTANNVQDVFIDVLDARQKILLLANSPHPDLGAIRESVEANKNYQVDVSYIRDNVKANIANYDFVVLHQLPGKGVDLSGVLSVLDKNRIPRLFIAGSQSDLVALNRLQNLVSIQSDGRNTNDVQATLAGNFSLFLIDENLRKELGTFPPIQAPFGEFKAGGSAQVMMYQRIRKIDTQYPLLVFGETSGARTGLLLAEGIWRWRLFNFLQDENHEVFDQMISKVVQYLGVKEDKRKFRVNVNKNIFRENEQVFFDAELYNKSYELFNEPDVQIVITGGRGKDYTYTFDKSGKAYTLNAGTLPVGNYRFEAKTNVNGEQLTFKGQFSIEPIQLEQYETTADHRLLRLLSDRFGGKMIHPDQMSQLPDLIKAQGNVKPVIYTNTTTRSLINIRWLFALLLILLTGEWFLRRYFGSY